MREPNGEDIRRERLARGWSQAKLAQLAGVSTNTVNRIETVRDYNVPRTLPKVARALGITAPLPPAPEPPKGPDEDGPPLRRATAGQLTAELARRLAEHEQLTSHDGHRVVAHDRIRTGELPPGLTSRPDVGLGPRVDDDQDEASADS